MFIKLIEGYINNMSIDDLIFFSHQENVFLNENEYTEIYDYVKNNWYVLIKNKEIVKKYLDDHFDKEKAVMIYEIYLKYMKKYRIYL